MIKPIFQIKKESEGKNGVRFVISPLEHGYGHTMGNALRRVLLESLGGWAISSVRISGVKHQFSTLKGMKEDIVEFLLNLKKVRFIFDLSDNKNKDRKAKLSVKGPGEVKARDIKVSGGLRIANPELVLAYLDKGGKIEAEMIVKHGRGYKTANEQEEKGIGVIPVDSIFSPIWGVNYKVEETRVGRFTNYDKLVLDIKSDGTIKPKDALVEASKILISYFNQVVTPKKIVKKKKKEEDGLGAAGKLSVEEIGLPTRVANALIKSGYDIVEDLVNAKKEDLVKVRNLGEKSIKIITLALAEKGIKFPKD